VAGVEAVDGETDNQAAFEEAEMVLIPEESVMVRVWEAGGAPVKACVKVRLVGDAVSVDGTLGATVKMTGMLRLADPPLTLIVA
jgi:hypothetical protein